MTADDEFLAEVRARADAATPGPWKRSGDYIDGAGYAEVITRGPVTCMAYCYGGTSTIEWERPDADAAFIAAAREDVPRLLGMVERRDAALAAVLKFPVMTRDMVSRGEVRRWIEAAIADAMGDAT